MGIEGLVSDLGILLCRAIFIDDFIDQSRVRIIGARKDAGVKKPLGFPSIQHPCGCSSALQLLGTETTRKALHTSHSRRMEISQGQNQSFGEPRLAGATSASWAVRAVDMCGCSSPGGLQGKMMDGSQLLLTGWF